MFFEKLSERKSKFEHIDVRLKHFGNRFDRRRLNKIKKYLLSIDDLKKKLTGQADLVFFKKRKFDLSFIFCS